MKALKFLSTLEQAPKQMLVALLRLMLESPCAQEVSLVCVEPEPLFRAPFASIGEKTWPVQKRPELHSVQVEGVLGCHCSETGPPEHHGDILDLASVAWNPGSSKNNREEMVSVGTSRKVESSDGDLHLMGEEDREKDSEGVRPSQRQ